MNAKKKCQAMVDVICVSFWDVLHSAVVDRINELASGRSIVPANLNPMYALIKSSTIGWSESQRARARDDLRCAEYYLAKGQGKVALRMFHSLKRRLERAGIREHSVSFKICVPVIHRGQQSDDTQETLAV